MLSLFESRHTSKQRTCESFRLPLGSTLVRSVISQADFRDFVQNSLCFKIFFLKEEKLPTKEKNRSSPVLRPNL